MQSLFSIFLHVRTASSRPAFWPEESGCCLFFLFAHDEDEARARADAILESLPYVSTSDVARVWNCDTPDLSVFEPPTPESTAFIAAWGAMEAKARAAGLSFAFLATFDPNPRVGETYVMRPRPREEPDSA